MIKRKKITVTNHAIRRYIERAYPLKVSRERVQELEVQDREKIIAELLDDYKRAKLIRVNNGHTYYRAGSLVLVIEHGTRRLKTVLNLNKFKL